MGGGKLGGYTSSGPRVFVLATVDFLRRLLSKLLKQCRKYCSLSTDTRNFRCRLELVEVGLVEGLICDLRVKLSGIYDPGVFFYPIGLCLLCIFVAISCMYRLFGKGIIFGYIVL